MYNKKTFSSLVQENIRLFGEEGLDSVITDKGYWTKEAKKFLSSETLAKTLILSKYGFVVCPTDIYYRL